VGIACFGVELFHFSTSLLPPFGNGVREREALKLECLPALQSNPAELWCQSSRSNRARFLAFLALLSHRKCFSLAAWWFYKLSVCGASERVKSTLWPVSRDPAIQSSGALVSIFKVKPCTFPRVFSSFESPKVLPFGRVVVL
jgi:hypothetical protein